METKMEKEVECNAAEKKLRKVRAGRLEVVIYASVLMKESHL